ncbi:MAG TPA: fumarate hydratase [Synergistaceae bacterium]|nr:fumarate hydratase [Synergistaceae bacterium]
MRKAREIDVSLVSEAVKGLFIKANVSIGQDVYNALVQARDRIEESPIGRSVLDQIIRNHDLARADQMPICQDTGMAVVFVDVGQDVALTGGDLTAAINLGVEEAYREGYFRKSIVEEPLFDRRNTGTNTPAVIHTRIVPGDRVKILVTPKGFGSENKSALKLFTPAQGPGEVRDFIRDTVAAAGPDPCPPLLIGVGVGGTVESAAIMAKRATLYSVGRRNPDRRYAALEMETLEAVNALGIGPAGLGGTVTCLDIHMDFAPGHIAGTPVVVNICCHAARHAEVSI